MDNKMTQGEMAAAFNEWMRRYVEDPEAFEASLKTVKEFLAQEQPTYGDVCAAYLLQIHGEL